MSSLLSFVPELWLANGPVITAALGFQYSTRMAVIRLQDGGLFIWSPIALTVGLKGEIDALGPVCHIIAPNHLHDSFLTEWALAYPEAKLHAAPGLAEKRPDLSFASTLSDEAPAGWQNEIEQCVVGGNSITTEVVFFHKASGTTLFTDLLQQFPKGWFKGWRALIARLDLMTEPTPSVPRKFRVAFRDKATAREALRKVLNWPSKAVVIAHGNPVTSDGAAYLNRAFRWLKVS
ncbi:hypothetical protein PSE_4626 [Pseudovibrio sp. FO-BEG1]|uniref:DUF4336 domain-containing protein n=1 Tax=Pseudovibrio sp. (strain FO-BEG1) TaxID=911045 RepID=UPI000238CA73|nr:DUF4336 domain-containing protein [Pseudovibrio sp. FO-BEG1]AEV39128.1 hypothetical protein PSE_4626 [Pseudovibrio sp. FO-BEG1]